MRLLSREKSTRPIQKSTRPIQQLTKASAAASAIVSLLQGMNHLLRQSVHQLLNLLLPQLKIAGTTSEESQLPSKARSHINDINTVDSKVGKIKQMFL